MVELIHHSWINIKDEFNFTQNRDARLDYYGDEGCVINVSGGFYLSA